MKYSHWYVDYVVNQKHSGGLTNVYMKQLSNSMTYCLKFRMYIGPLIDDTEAVCQYADCRISYVIGTTVLFQIILTNSLSHLGKGWKLG